MEIIDNKVEIVKSPTIFKGKVEKVDNDELQEDLILDDEMEFLFDEDEDLMGDEELDDMFSLNDDMETEEEIEEGELQDANELDDSEDFENYESKHAEEVEDEMDLTNIESHLSGMFGETDCVKNGAFIVTENGNFECNTCRKEFSKRSNIRKHWIDVHSGIRFPCNQCSYMAKRRDNLSKHIKRKHTGL